MIDDQSRIEAPVKVISPEKLTEILPPTNGRLEEVSAATHETLMNPCDFPSIRDSVIEGDRIALAVDPSVSQIGDVLRGVLDAVKQTGATEISVVVRDEASEEIFELVSEAAAPHKVLRHECADREAHSYLAADVDANPIYLNRELVDADWVLPIVACRHTIESERRDLSGVFPWFCDSATRLRQAGFAKAPAESPRLTPSGRSIAQETPWLLGVQMVLAVAMNSHGEVAAVRAGTVESLNDFISGDSIEASDLESSDAPLVLATCDGGVEQQTWENVVRAAIGAAKFAEDDGTIVVWSGLGDEPEGPLLGLDQTEQSVPDFGDSSGEDDLPAWNRLDAVVGPLQELTQSYRLILYSRISRESIERLGLGVVESERELENLQRGFDRCIVLRAASYAGDL